MDEKTFSGDDLVVVTGGAGFIGSNVVHRLAATGARIVVCDRLGSGEKWRNLSGVIFHDIVAPAALLGWLAIHADKVTAIVHMGAISSTTEANVDRIVSDNIRATLDLWAWCASNGTRLIYASSAATYGDGKNGFQDNEAPEALAKLLPLNAYGWSKHQIDRRIISDVRQAHPVPPQWAGLKFFNVYGPREDHKGDMRSVINKIYPHIVAGEAVSLFRSHHPEYEDGGQLRDFIFVQDCVEVIAWLLANPSVSGLFNVGTGMARSFKDLAAATFTATDRKFNVVYNDMPENIRGKYQYFTQADTEKLRKAGFRKPFTSLEDGVLAYVRNHLERR